MLQRELDLWEADPSAHPAIERRIAGWYRRRGGFIKMLGEVHPDLMLRHMANVGMPVLPEDGGAKEHSKHAPFRAVRVSFGGGGAVGHMDVSPFSYPSFCPASQPPFFLDVLFSLLCLYFSGVHR